MRPAWVTRQITGFIRQFCAPSGNAAWIGVSDSDMLSPVDRTSLRSGPFRDRGGYVAQASLNFSDGFVWVPEAAGEEPELWLSPQYRSYRAAFEKFAVRYLGASGLTGADVQIDHVFPKKAAALDGIAYVRMLAIPPEGNMDAGRTMERAMTERAATAPRGKLVRLATYYAVGKAAGFQGYEHLPDSRDPLENLPSVRALFAHLRKFGLPADVLTAFDEQLTARTHVTHR